MVVLDTTPATLKDVARDAGVSLATVDRVLHGRPGVADRTERKVRETIERLGFRPLAAAALLARTRNLRLAFVIPRGSNRFMAELVANIHAIRDWFSERRISVEIVLYDALDAERLADVLAGASERFDGMAVVAVDHPLVRAAIDDLIANDVAVITLVSDVPTSKRGYYVGIDNIAAGRTAGMLIGRFVGRRAGRIGVISASLALRDHVERLYGFNQLLSMEFPQLTVLPPLESRDDLDTNRKLTARLLAREPDIVAIYNTGDGSGGIGEALTAAGRAGDTVFVCHDLTQPTRSMLIEGVADALVVQDPGHQARSAGRVLFAMLTGGDILPEQERIRVEVILRDNLP